MAGRFRRRRAGGAAGRDAARGGDPDRRRSDGGEAVHTQPNFATHPIISRRWVEIQGCVTPPYFSCDYADTWLNDLANDLGRKRLLPIFNEHMHWSLGKSPVDMTYVENRQRFQEDNVIEKYIYV